jgi:hypothetical protein
MNWEEFFKMVAGGLFLIISGIATYHLKELITTGRSLQMSVEKLVDKVERLDKENETLRRSHDALTRFLISKGILSPPDPSTLNGL